MGRLTRDPELRTTNSGTSVASFSLAVDRNYKGADGEKETDFIDCVAWRQTGEFAAKYFAKGRMAVVEGRLQIRPWTDKEGNNRRSAEVMAEVEKKINEVIDRHLPVTIEFMPKEEAGDIVDLSKLPDDASDTLRIVRIGDYDACACIGSHVANTSEIGHFKLLNYDYADGRLRLRFKLV